MTRVTVTGLTAARMIDIEQSSIVSGRVSGDNLVLKTKGGDEVTAGNVRGQQGEKGEPGGIWDAEADKTGAIKLAGNLGGTAHNPKVTGVLDDTVDGTAVKVTTTAPSSGGQQEVTLNLSQIFSYVLSIEQALEYMVGRAGRTETLWTGSIHEYNALPSEERLAPGFVAVITSS